MKSGVCVVAIAVIGFGVGSVPSAIAQILPDATLPENSIVLPPLHDTLVIEGGTQVGSNLFHSFTDFSVPTGWEALFNHPVSVENILTRITGTAPSHIDGLIRTSGTANLFLINPHGIVFGPNARLDIGGSFLATSAEGVVLADGSLYSATEPDAPPLLTINVPVGLQFGEVSGQILARSPTLAVKPDRTLSLLGGDVKLEDTSLIAPEGRIEVGSVAADTQVSFNPTDVALGYENVEQFGEIEIARQSVLDTSGMGGGEIQLRGGRVFLTGESAISSKTLGSENGGDIAVRAERFLLEDGSFISTETVGSGTGGDIKIEASDAVELSGRGNLFPILLDLAESRFESEDIRDGIYAVSFGAGDAGNITIQTDRLLMTNGAIVSTSTFDRGRGGQLEVTATDATNIYTSALITGTDGTGTAGDLVVSTPRLGLYDGGMITTTSLSEGRGGNVTIRASDWVELVSSLTLIELPVKGILFLFGSNVIQSLSFSSGDAGNIRIETGRLTVKDRSEISTATNAAGRAGNIAIAASESINLLEVIFDLENPQYSVPSGVVTNTETLGSGGNITIKTPRLIVRDGGQIQAATWGSGSGGTIDIDTQSLILRDGSQIHAVTFASGRGGTIDNKASDFIELSGQNSGIFVSSQLNATGNSGNVNLQTGTLIVRDGAVITAAFLEPAYPSGDAGNIDIVTDNIYLDNGIIRSDTGQGNFGNIRLRSSDIQLRRGSLISANSGSQGGNIDIDTELLSALENSDISANSQQSEGGRITVNTQGLLGTQFRDVPSPRSDLTATSALGVQFNGIVDINLEGVDPTSGLVEFPDAVVDAESLFDTRCLPGNSPRSQFALTGRGGIPPSAREALSNIPGWVDSNSMVVPPEIPQPTLETPRAALVEAQGWIVNEMGQIELVAEFPNGAIEPNLQPEIESSQSQLPSCGIGGRNL